MNLRRLLPWAQAAAGEPASAPTPVTADSSLANSNSPVTCNKESIDEDDFEIIQNHPPYSKPLKNLIYKIDDPGLCTSSHRVVECKDSSTGESHILKFNLNEPMIYAEAFLSHLYSLSLLYGVARCCVRYNENCKPEALSSKKIENFRTFKDKDCQLTQQQLANPAFRHRFLRILAVMHRMHEDDAHAGNLTIDLKIFDPDCANWDVTCKIKGGRSGVDYMIPINRNPETSFVLHEEDAVNFPAITHAKPWYNPCLDSPATLYFNNNPFTAAETKLVRDLKNDPEAMLIFFQEALDWMFDLSMRFPHVARLHFPDKLTVKDENVIHLYCENNDAVNIEYWNILPVMPELKQFLKRSWEQVLLEILVRCEIRNFRMENDRKAHPSWDKLFAATLLDPQIVIDKYNELASQMNNSQILAFSYSIKHPSIVNQSCLFDRDRSILVSGPMMVMDKINMGIAAELIAKAKVIAQELIVREQKHGTEAWEIFLPEQNVHVSRRAQIRTSCG